MMTTSSRKEGGQGKVRMWRGDYGSCPPAACKHSHTTHRHAGEQTDNADPQRHAETAIQRLTCKGEQEGATTETLAMDSNGGNGRPALAVARFEDPVQHVKSMLYILPVREARVRLGPLGKYVGTLRCDRRERKKLAYWERLGGKDRIPGNKS